MGNTVVSVSREGNQKIIDLLYKANDHLTKLIVSCSIEKDEIKRNETLRLATEAQAEIADFINAVRITGRC